MDTKARYGPFVVLEHRSVLVFAAAANLPAGSEKQLRVKFARAVQNEIIDTIIDEVEGNRPFHLGREDRGEIVVLGIAYILSNPFWTIPVYRVKMQNRKTAAWSEGTYQDVRWNTGVDSGVVVLCLTKDDRIVFIDEFRHTMRHLATIREIIEGFEVPRFGLRTELIRGLRMPPDQSGAEESVEDAAKRIAGQNAGVIVPESAEVAFLGRYDADTGVLSQHVEIAIVKGVEIDLAKMRPDVPEAIYGSFTLSLQETCDRIRRGELSCGFTHSALLQAALHGHLSLA